LCSGRASLYSVYGTDRGTGTFLLISKLPSGVFAILLFGVTLAYGDGPQPPCAGEAEPAYPVLGAAPSVQTWERQAWTVPSCLGWPPASDVTLIATAARFTHTSGIEGLRQRLASVSHLAGWLYWSTTNHQWQPWILDAYALRGPSAEQRRPDFAPAEITEGQTLYTLQEDNLFGKIVFQVRIQRLATDRLVFLSENSSPARLLAIPVFGPGEMQSAVFLEQESKGVWRYYSIGRLGKPASLLPGQQSSLINRAVASYRYLAGIPADLEPPAAR
jgi:hypothetical protein